MEGQRGSWRGRGQGRGRGDGRGPDAGYSGGYRGRGDGREYGGGSSRGRGDYSRGGGGDWRSGGGRRPGRGRGFGDSGSFGAPKNYPPVNPIKVEDRLGLKKTCKAKPSFVPRPPRPAVRLGQPIQLVVNHFAIRIPDITVYQYDLQINVLGRTGQVKPPPPPKQKKRQVPGAAPNEGQSQTRFRKLKQTDNRRVLDTLIKEHENQFKDEAGKRITVVYDGEKIMLTPKKLKLNEFTEAISMFFDQSEPSDGIQVPGRRVDLQVQVQFTSQIDLSLVNDYYQRGAEVSREVLQAFDIIFRHGPTERRVPIGKSLYPKQEPGDGNAIGINKEVRFGHYQAFHMTESGPTLLVDRSATPFFKPKDIRSNTLIGFIQAMLNQLNEELPINQLRLDKLESWKLRKIKEALEGLRVYSLHLNYKRGFTIKSIGRTPAEESFKLDQDGKERTITVLNYFEEFHGGKLKDSRLNYANLPVVIPKGGKTNYLPMELLYVYPDQPVPKSQIGPQETSYMIRKCGQQGPDDRFGEIQQAVANVKNDSQAILQEFQIEIDTRPLMVTGRIIDKPLTQGLDGKGFKSAPELTRWVFIDMSGRRQPPDKVNKFIADLIQEGLRMRMKIAQPKIIPANTRDIESHFKWAKDQKVQLLMFAIDDNSSYRPTIKFYGDVAYGLATQCVKSNNIFTGNKIQHLLLFKINTKIGGVNRTVDGINFRPLNQPKDTMIDMIIGADVTHPAPGSPLPSSVAAVVGTYNNDYFKYYATVSVQQRSSKRNAVEMILEFETLFGELVTNFYKHNKRYPKTILYYRDGVSDSQFSQVLQYECDKIKTAYHKLTVDQPKVTFVTVQKRHHTRFRPADLSKGTGPKKNVPPGTAVDSGVVHPTDFDFYLTSHTGIQGTSRPTHYYVLQDDNKFSADDLQRLTYHLCYNYSRCETPISIPPPVQYAHLAAARSKDHIVARSPGVRRVVGNTEQEQLEEERKIARELNEFVQVKYKDSMYFS